MAKRLYIGNLSYNTTEATLTSTFNASSVVIPTDHSGRPKGFAFVDVEDDQAQALIDKWNGQDLEGRNIVVSEARPREDRGSQGGGNNFRRAA